MKKKCESFNSDNRYELLQINKRGNSKLFVQALLKYISQVHQGVRGVIRDMSTHQPIRTTGLKIEGRDSYFRTTSRGEFWRILLPGTYKLQVRSTRFDQQKIGLSAQHLNQWTERTAASGGD